MYHFYAESNVRGIFNVGTGRARTWNDLANAVFSALEIPTQIEYIDMPEIMREKYQYFTQADLSKMREKDISISFASLENSVADYVKNYLEKNSAFLA